MLEPGGDLDLAGEAAGAHGRGDLGAQDLERHLAVVLHVQGEVDRRHPALPELALERVAVRERRAERIEWAGQEWPSCEGARQVCGPAGAGASRPHRGGPRATPVEEYQPAQ